ncbi:CSC1/OSCA1-like, 7TM region [Dillenia turbinata]|uniref:CSC1/OSCA1-like, 7TM region n=1 Tax=Dillenia turbinata TaxID=194707 RepID=A0AAN8ZAR9_9MAGN
MIVSALLTSVGINFGLCVLFFTLYSILRKQPCNYDVYIPRLLAEGKSQQRSSFILEWLLPSTSWVKRAWQTTEEELLLSSGLDAVVFMRIFIFSLRVFCLAGIIGIFVLLPVNCLGTQLAQFDIAELSNISLDLFTISNVNNGSKWWVKFGYEAHSLLFTFVIRAGILHVRENWFADFPYCILLPLVSLYFNKLCIFFHLSCRLWAHFCAVYIVTGFVCYLLYYEYNYISSKRIEYFYSSKPQPHQFTVLVRSIPVAAGSSVSDSVEKFFTEYYPTTYLSHMVVRRTNKIRGLIDEAKKLYKRITALQSGPTKTKYGREGYLGLFGRKVDLVDHYEKKLEDLEENVRLEQSEASLAGEEIRAAFVSFKTRYAASTACHMQQSINPTRWVTEEAPEPHDVNWPFFSSSFLRRWFSKLAVVVVYILVTVLFLIPVVFVQGLTNLDQLELMFPFLKSILTLKFVSQVVTGYLPSFILQLFLKTVPPVMKFLSSIQGYISISQIEKSACNRMFWFTVWNIFFGNVLSGSVLNQISTILDPENIPSKLAVAVPAQASFFIAYVVTIGWTSASTELFRIIPLICSLIRNPCGGDKDDELEAPPPPYHRDIPKILFFGLLGITYFFLAPLILPFLLVYFCLGYIIYRNQFLNVYSPRYEAAGKFWPIVHNSMIFSLVLMHAIAVGIFTLKKLSMASTLTFPLPVFTLIFNEYCRKRFLPNFVAYSAESLIKKDRGDIHDGSMEEFFESLVTAYQDPALLPIQYSSHTDGHSTPLLRV